MSGGTCFAVAGDTFRVASLASLPKVEPVVSLAPGARGGMSAGTGEGGMGSNRVDAFFDTETWVLSVPRVVDGRCFDLHASAPVG